MKYAYLIFAVLLLLCLAPMPYSYYQLIRFASMTLFLMIAYQYYNNQKIEHAIFFSALALLFQPFLKVALGRTLWNIVDVITAIILISLYYTTKEKK